MWNAVDPGALEDDVSVRVGAMTVVSAEDFGGDEADKHGRPLPEHRHTRWHRR